MIGFDLDVAIFVTFLAGTIVVGLRSSRGTYNITQYAVGDRNFSTATLVATIVATWISGEFFYSSITEAYKNGLYSIWIALGDPLYLLCIGLFFAPRMGEFLGNLSIAEAMGNLYGDKVRVLTAIAGTIGSAGLIAIQLKLSGSIFEYALGITSIQGTIIATIIVTIYSSLGGIKSVTFTDVIQFFTFAVVIPIAPYTVL
jgi:Na+/proline symporter